MFNGRWQGQGDAAIAQVKGVPAPFGIAVALALLAGAGTCLLLPALPAAGVLWLLLPLGFIGWWRGDYWRVTGIFLLGFALAGLHVHHALQLQLPPTLEASEQVLHGQVVELPQHQVRRTRFRLRVDPDSGPPALRGQLLQLAWYDPFDAKQPGPRMQLRAGERWQMTLKLRAPRGLRNPGGFDSERNALVQRIAAQGYLRDPESARRLATATGVDAWREQMGQRISAAVAVPSARFIRALAVGDTGGLGDADWEILRANGLTHLIAISGFHVGLAAGFFALFARVLWWLFPRLAYWLPRPLAAGLAAIVGAVAYTVVAGFALPTVRTMLMIAVVVLARIWRRPQSIAQALALAAIVILLLDPLAPLTAGFWLSFAGVAWLLWCMPRGSGHLVKDFLGAQLVATIGLLPLTVVLFGQASSAGLLANLLAVPWWSLVVVPLALLGLAMETVWPGAGGLPWRLAAWAFDGSWPVFAWLAQTPVAFWWLPEGRWYALPLALLGAGWCLLPRAIPGKPMAALLWLPLLWPPRDLPPVGQAELVLIDVGQGLSVLVRTAGHSLLFDMGPAVEDGFDAGERAVVPALHALGVRRLDAMIVSHGDNDHAGGLASVQRAFPVDVVLAPEHSPVAASAACRAGTHWNWDGVQLQFLHPPPHFPYLKNESSCVLRIQARDGAALLTGDIGEVIERRLLREQPEQLAAEVVVVAHHGSAGSSIGGFVRATGARLALVSSGHGNRFGHPAPIVVRRWIGRGARVLDTADSGAIRVRLGSAPEARPRRSAPKRIWDAVARGGLSYRPE